MVAAPRWSEQAGQYLFSRFSRSKTDSPRAFAQLRFGGLGLGGGRREDASPTSTAQGTVARTSSSGASSTTSPSGKSVPGPPTMGDETARQVRAVVAKGATGVVMVLKTDDCFGTYQQLKAKGVELTLCRGSPDGRSVSPPRAASRVG